MAALFEVCIGLFGIVGFLMRFIGPITIAPTIILMGMALSSVTAKLCAKQWWIAIMLVQLWTPRKHNYQQLCIDLY